MHQVDERLLPFFTALLVRERPLAETRLRAPPVTDFPFFLTVFVAVRFVAVRFVAVRAVTFLRPAPLLVLPVPGLLPLRLFF